MPDEEVAAPGTRESRNEAVNQLDEDAQVAADFTEGRVLQDSFPHSPTKRAQPKETATEASKEELAAPPGPRIRNPFDSLRVGSRETPILRNGRWVSENSNRTIDEFVPEMGPTEEETREQKRAEQRAVFTGFSDSNNVPTPTGSYQAKERQEVHPVHPDIEQFKSLDTMIVNQHRNITEKRPVDDYLSKQQEMHDWWLEKTKTPYLTDSAGGVLGYTPNQRSAAIDERTMFNQYGPAHRPSNPAEWRIHESLQHQTKYLPTTVPVPRWYTYTKRTAYAAGAYWVLAMPFGLYYLNSATMDNSWHFTKVTDYSNERDKYVCAFPLSPLPIAVHRGVYAFSTLQLPPKCHICFWGFDSA